MRCVFLQHGQLLHEAFGFYSPRRFPPPATSGKKRGELEEEEKEKGSFQRFGTKKRTAYTENALVRSDGGECGDVGGGGDDGRSLSASFCSRLDFHFQRRERLSKLDGGHENLLQAETKRLILPSTAKDVSLTPHRVYPIMDKEKALRSLSSPFSSFLPGSLRPSSTAKTEQSRQKKTFPGSLTRVTTEGVVEDSPPSSNSSDRDERSPHPSRWSSLSSGFSPDTNDDAEEVIGRRRSSASCNQSICEGDEAKQNVDEAGNEGQVASARDRVPDEEDGEKKTMEGEQRKEEERKKDLSERSEYAKGHLSRGDGGGKLSPRTLLVTSMDTARGLHFDGVGHGRNMYDHLDEATLPPSPFCASSGFFSSYRMLRPGPQCRYWGRRLPCMSGSACLSEYVCTPVGTHLYVGVSTVMCLDNTYALLMYVCRMSL